MWQEVFADRLTRDRDLSELTTIRVGGPARNFVAPANDDEVGRLLAALSAEGVGWRVLGGGSNLLVGDEGVSDDVVIHPAALTESSLDGPRLRAGAGCALSALVAKANAAGLAGLHRLAGIPGQVGGALVMNAGGRYGWIDDLVETVNVRLCDGTAAVLDRDAMHFDYRSSRLPDGAVITGCTLLLDPVDDARALRRESGRILKEKNRAQPTTGWNFGCMFANPPGHSAGKLVQDAGLGGLTRGDARISPLHGNFVENLGHARAADVRALIEQAETTVREKTGVELRREVKVWVG